MWSRKELSSLAEVSLYLKLNILYLYIGYGFFVTYPPWRWPQISYMHLFVLFSYWRNTAVGNPTSAVPCIARRSVQPADNSSTRKRFSRACPYQQRAANRSHSQMRKGDFVSYKCKSDVKVMPSEKPPSWVKGEPRPSLKIRCDWVLIVCWIWTELYGRNMEPGVCLLSFVVPLQHNRICRFFVHGEGRHDVGFLMTLFSS